MRSEVGWVTAWRRLPADAGFEPGACGQALVASEHRDTQPGLAKQTKASCEDRSGNSQTLWGARAC